MSSPDDPSEAEEISAAEEEAMAVVAETTVAETGEAAAATGKEDIRSASLS